VTTTADWVYLDASALVKLVVAEPESDDLRVFLASFPQRITCALARVETVRAVREQGPVAVQRARAVIANIDQIHLDTPLLDDAAQLDHPIRSLDAIHVAAARTVGSGLRAVVTYDRRMSDAARASGLNISAPGQAPRRP
jgi:predicted nucleic acid-binding protein